MHNIDIPIAIMLSIVYLYLGVPYTKWLCENWTWLNTHARNNLAWAWLTLVLWLPILLSLASVKVWELLTESRTKDWEVKPKNHLPRE